MVLEMQDTNSFLYETKMQNGLEITKDIVSFHSKYIPTLQLSPVNNSNVIVNRNLKWGLTLQLMVNFFF
jgi:hypothetical protein